MRGRGVLALVGVALLLALTVWWVSRSGPDSVGLAPELGASSVATSAAPGIQTPLELAGSAERAGSRSAPALPAAADPGSTAPRIDTAVLRVSVKAKEDGHPLEHVHVSAWRDGGTVLASGQAILTDGEGMADIQVPAGIDLLVSAQGEGARAGNATLPVVALAPGERREVTLLVASGPDLVFCGRILDRDSKAPVANAQIVPIDAREGGQEDVVVSRGDGSFQIDLRSWLAKALQIDAATHGRALVRIVPGHETPARALEILLDRGASITARVLRADGSGILGHTVALRASAFDLVRPSGAWIDGVGTTSWESVSGADGTAHFPSLTAGAPLNLMVLEGTTEVWSIVQPIVLAPGEARTIDCRIESGAQIVGRAREADGRPAEGVEIWLAPARAAEAAFFMYLDSTSARRTKVDANGSFRFDTVPVGNWSVGPGPSAERDPASDPAPVAQHIVIAPGLPEILVDIVVERGVLISGRVLDPAGRPAAFAWIQAWRIGTAQHIDAHSAPTGEFQLGPLVAGEWALSAAASGSFVKSNPVTVAAGARDVVLRIAAGSTLSARILDAQGAPVAGVKVSAMPAGPGDVTAQITGPDGMAVFEKQKPGRWNVVASTGDGRIAVREGVELSATEGAAIDLVLEPGVRARVKFVGPTEQAYLFVMRGDTGLDFHMIAAGQTLEITAPIGRSRLRMSTRPGGNKDREVDLRAGATPEYVFDGGWQ